MPKPRLKGKRSLSGRHVQLPEYLQASEAWATMKPAPRALYIEIKRRFNGSNNGKLFLSVRDAAKAINVSKNTVGQYFTELEKRGFIHKVQGGYLGPNGKGQAAVWAIDEEPTQDGQPARKGFMRWVNQKPVQKTGTPRTKKRDTFSELELIRPQAVPKLGQKTLN